MDTTGSSSWGTKVVLPEPSVSPVVGSVDSVETVDVVELERRVNALSRIVYNLNASVDSVETVDVVELERRVNALSRIVYNLNASVEAELIRIKAKNQSLTFPLEIYLVGGKYINGKYSYCTCKKVYNSLIDLLNYDKDLAFTNLEDAAAKAAELNKNLGGK